MSEEPEQSGNQGNESFWSAEKLLKIVEEPSVKGIVNRIISAAMKMKASGIVLLPGEKNLAVRFVIDDTPVDIMAPPAHIRRPVLARLKYIAGLDPVEEGGGVEGVIALRFCGMPCTLELSTEEGEWGEAMTIRIIR